MRSNVTVYRVPDNGPPFARYAPSLWNCAPRPPPQNACYNLQTRLQHAPTLIKHTPAPPAPPLLHPLYNAAPVPPHPPRPNYGHVHYGAPLVNQQRINECAGIPLISNASSHLTTAQRQRLLRKTAQTPKSWAPVGGNISQLAAHAHGMPLLQANKHQTWCMPLTSYQPITNARYQTQSPPLAANFKLPDKTRALRYQNSAPPALGNKEQNSCVQERAPATSPATDTCLPRIIKPRKRRKKDRKPANGVFLKMDAEVQQKLQHAPLATARKSHKSTEDLFSCFGSITTTYMAASPLQLGHAPAPQHDDTHGVCFCRDCDPLRSLWDYPLRRSSSDASSEQCSGSSSSTSSDTSCASSICSQNAPSQGHASNSFEEAEHFAPINGNSSRANIVGVIGSQRSISHDSGTASKMELLPNVSLCFSDSSDSGYGDILSGINIADDLFGNGNSFGCSNAETLLNESINEISRKLIETCAVNEPTMTPTSQDSGGSGIDSACSYNNNSNVCDALVFNFEHLNLMDTNFALPPPTALDFLVDCNNNSDSSSSTNIKATAAAQQHFYNNCFDLVWQQQRDDNNKVAAAKSSNNASDSNATPTSLILGTVGKLKPAFSTIS